MTTWLMSIVGVVFLGVMIDIITPEGKTNNFIKSIFAVFVLYIIISPIVNLVGKEFEFTYEEVDLQENYLESVANVKVDTLESELQKTIEDAGYECFVEIDGNVWGSSVNINKITIFLPNSVLLSVDEHINNCKVITQLVRKVVEVNEEVIEYERM